MRKQAVQLQNCVPVGKRSTYVRSEGEKSENEYFHKESDSVS